MGAHNDSRLPWGLSLFDTDAVRVLSLSAPKDNRRILMLFSFNDRFTVRGEN